MPDFASENVMPLLNPGILRAIEVEADRLMLELYRELYAGKYDPIQTFMVHDFYEILEKAIDRCREAGVVTYQIVLKNN